MLNPTGRKPGQLNKVNAEVKQLLAQAAQHNLPAVNKAIESLLKSDNEAVQSRGVELYLKLLEFSQPRLQAVAVKGDGISTGIIVIGKPADLEPVLDNDSIQDAVIDEDMHNLNSEADEE